MTPQQFKARREATGFSREEIGEISGHPAAVVLHAEQGRLPAYHWAWTDLESALELAEAWHAEELARAAPMEPAYVNPARCRRFGVLRYARCQACGAAGAGAC